MDLAVLGLKVETEGLDQGIKAFKAFSENAEKIAKDIEKTMKEVSKSFNLQEFAQIAQGAGQIAQAEAKKTSQKTKQFNDDAVKAYEKNVNQKIAAAEREANKRIALEKKIFAANANAGAEMAALFRANEEKKSAAVAKRMAEEATMMNQTVGLFKASEEKKSALVAKRMAEEATMMNQAVGLFRVNEEKKSAAVAKRMASEANAGAEMVALFRANEAKKQREAEKTAAKLAALEAKNAQAFASGAKQSAKALDPMKKAISGLVGDFQKIQNIAVGAFVGVSLAKVAIDLADSYTKLTGVLKVATAGTADYGTALEAVQNISSKAQADINNTATLYSRLIRNTDQLGASQNDVAKITETVALALKAEGRTVVETNSVMLQLSQAFGSGVLRGEEFNTMSENGSLLLDILAKSMGIARGQLRGMAEQGKLTADILKEAYTNDEVLEGLRAQAKEMLTIGGALTELRNQLVIFLGQSNEQSGAIKGLSALISALAKNIDLVTVAITGYFATRLIAKFAEVASVTRLIVIQQLEQVAASSAVTAATVAETRAMTANTAGQLANANARKAGLASAAAQAVTSAGAMTATRAVAGTLLRFIANPWVLGITGALYLASEAFDIFGEKSQDALKGAEDAGRNSLGGMLATHQQRMKMLDEEIEKLDKKIALQKQELGITAPEVAPGAGDSALALAQRAVEEARRNMAYSLSEARNADGVLPAGAIQQLQPVIQAYADAQRQLTEIQAKGNLERQQAQELFDRDFAARYGDKQAQFQQRLIKEQEKAAAAGRVLTEEQIEQIKKQVFGKDKLSNETQKLIEKLRVENDTLEAQIKVGRDLSDSERERIELTAKYKGQLPEVIANELDRQAALEKVIATRKEEKELEEEFQKLQDDYDKDLEKRIKKSEKETERIEKGNAELKNRIAVMKGQVDPAQNLEAAYQDLLAVELEREAVQRRLGGEDAVAAQLEAQARAVRERAKLLREEQATEIALELEKVNQQFLEGFLGAFERGTDEGIDYLKDQLKRQAFQILINATIGNVGALGGALSNVFGTGSNLISGGGFGGGIGNPLSFGDTFGSFGSGFSNSALMFEDAALGLGNTIANTFGDSAFSDAILNNSQTIGQVGATLGAIGTAVSGFNALKNGQYGSAAGQGIGYAFGGPIGAAIGGAIGGALDKAFSGEKRRDDTAILENGVLTVSSGNGRPLSPDFTQQITQGTIDAINNTLTSLGSAAQLVAFEGKLQTSGKGRGGVRTEGVLSDGTQVGDFIRVGRGYENNRNTSPNAELAFELYVEQLDQLFLQTLQAASGDFAQNIDEYLTSLGDVELLKPEQLQAAKANVVLLNAVNTEFGKMENNLGDLANQSFKTIESFIKSVGGLQNLQQSFSGYVSAIYSEQEQLDLAASNLTSTFERLGVEMPNLELGVDSAKDEFQNLVEGLDLTVEADQRLYAALLALAPTFAEVARQANELNVALSETDRLQLRITEAYQEFLGIEPDAEGLRYWLEQVESGTLTIEQAYEAISRSGDAFLVVGREMEALETSLRSAADILKERADLEQQLFELTASEAELLQRQRDSIDEHNLFIFDQIQLIKKQQEQERELQNQRQAALREQEQILNRLRAIGGNISDYLRKLEVNEPTLSPQQALQNASANFNNQLTLARSGDINALQGITQDSDAFLNAARRFYGSGEEFQNILATVKAQLGGLTDTQTYEQRVLNALTVISDNTADFTQALSDLRFSFEALDLNRDELLSFNELRIGLEATEQELQILFGALGESLNGALSRVQTLIGESLSKEDLLASYIQTGFAKLDSNVDGLLTFEEVSRALADVATDAEIRNLFNLIDADGSGTISELEALNQKTEILAASIRDNLEPLFDQIDLDISGFITKEEFTQAFEVFGLGEKLDEIFSELDTNGDGVLTLLEEQNAILKTEAGSSVTFEPSNALKSVFDAILQSSLTTANLLVTLINTNIALAKGFTPQGLSNFLTPSEAFSILANAKEEVFGSRGNIAFSGSTGQDTGQLSGTRVLQDILAEVTETRKKLVQDTGGALNVHVINGGYSSTSSGSTSTGYTSSSPSGSTSSGSTSSTSSGSTSSTSSGSTSARETGIRFNADDYLAANRDVAQAGYTRANAIDHWRQFGIYEGRAANSTGYIFDPARYLRINTDVASAGTDPYKHYQFVGYDEGRSFANGGFVSGPGTGTSDSIMARISNGEYVMKASSVRNFGVDFMDSINQGRMPMMNMGEIVNELRQANALAQAQIKIAQATAKQAMADNAEMKAELQMLRKKAQLEASK